MGLESFLKIVGKNIVELRKSKFMNQKQIAEAVDLSYRYYQSVEAGVANLTLATVYRLANFFEVPPSRIITTPNKP